MNTLQKFVFGNGIFSVSTGIILVFFGASVARIFDVGNTLIFKLTGTGLLLFATFVFLEARKQRPLNVLSIIFLDMVWVLATIIILIVKPFELSVTGHELLGIVGVVVLTFAILQAYALINLDNVTGEEDHKRLTFQKMVSVPKSKAWKVISDVGNYHQVASNIDQVEIISGDKQGMVRSCSFKDDKWSEECVEWREEEQFSFVVNTKAKDYPYPFSYLKGTWRVEEVEPEKTSILMIFEFSFKWRYQDLLIYPFMKIKFTKICDDLLNRWEGQLIS